LALLLQAVLKIDYTQNNTVITLLETGKGDNLYFLKGRGILFNNTCYYIFTGSQVSLVAQDLMDSRENQEEMVYLE
jgi:hypothetical protein